MNEWKMWWIWHGGVLRLVDFICGCTFVRNILPAGKRKERETCELGERRFDTGIWGKVNGKSAMQVQNGQVLQGASWCDALDTVQGKVENGGEG